MNDLIIVSAVVTAVATLVYAILTLVILRETVRLRKVQTEPEIVLLIQSHERHRNLYEVVVKNTGAGAACNLSWKYDKNSKFATDDDYGALNKLKFFQGITYFPPGQEFRSLLGGGMELFSDPTLSLELVVEYENRIGQKDKRKFILDPILFYGASWIGNQPDITDSLHEIQRDIHQFSTGFHRLKIDVYDKNDRAREKKTLENHFKSMKRKRSSQSNPAKKTKDK